MRLDYMVRFSNDTVVLVWGGPGSLLAVHVHTQVHLKRHSTTTKKHSNYRSSTTSRRQYPRMHECMGAWMHGCMDAWIYGCMNA